MAGKADGSIRIRAIFDDEKAKKEIDKLENKFRRQVEDIDEQTIAVQRLQEKYDKLASREVEPASFKRLLSDIKKADAEVAKLDDEFQKLRDIADIDKAVSGKISPEIEAQLDDTNEKLTDALTRADALKKRFNEIRENPLASDEAKHLAQDIELATKRLENMKQEAAKTKAAIDGVSKGQSGKMGKLSSVMSRLKTSVFGGLKKTVTAAGTAVDKLRGRIKAVGKEKGFEKAGKSADRFRNRLKSIVSGALFFNAISAGLRQLTQSMSATLKTNTQFSKSLGLIKGNLLTAFQPIYDTVMPMLNTLMSAFSRITAQAASFISSVFGTDATQAQKNAKALYEQANATEAAGDAAEAAEKQLASFDTIQKLSDTSKKDTGKKTEAGEPDFTTDFKKVKTPAWLENFWKVFKDSWAKNGAKTIEAAKKAISSIKGVLESVGKAFMNVWTGGAGERVLNSIHGLLQNLLGTIAEIGQAFSAAWDSGLGESILTHIFGIITGIVDAVSNLAGKFREAWAANGNGEAIMSAILGIVDAILGTIDRIVQSTAQWAGNLNLEPLISGVRKVLEPLKDVVAAIGEALAEIWEEVALPFAKWIIEQAVPKILEWLGSFFNFLAEHKEFVKAFIEVIAALWLAFKAYTIVQGAISVFKGLLGTLTPLKLVLALIIPLVAGVISAWKDMSTLERVVSVLGLLVTAAAAAAIAVGALQSAWSLGIAAAAIVAGVIAITASINSATKRANSTGAISGNISDYSSSYSAASYSAARIPELADGAVISPNNEFLAILGDQKSGVNIETPLSTMKQAFREALAESGGGGRGSVSPSDVYIDGSKLARITWSYNQNEDSRRGVNLIENGAFS